ncbi:MAG: energy-coupling factor transporter ATPase [Chloroflexi bacterium]|nr:energy-coupling factor transporter ATPase [Chloroflexota bacterium]
MIDVRDLHHYFFLGRPEEIHALRGVNLHIDQGEMVALLGHNGSGKSTLVRHLNGLLLPDSGHVLINGMDTRDLDKIWEIRRLVGMVFQNPESQLVGTLVEEEVAFGPENLGIPRNEIKQRIHESLAAVDMENMLKAVPQALSGGQKQRLAVASILAMRPRCIVLDEPTTMLDPVGRREVMDTVGRLNREDGITVICITHDMEEAALFDRVIVMSDGVVAMDGTVSEIFGRVEELEKLRLSAPAMSLLANRLEKRGIRLPSNPLTVEQAVDVIAGIMPPTGELPPPAEVSSPLSGDVVIETNDLEYTYLQGTPFQKKALFGINSKVTRGEILGICGSTGSGKTTLVQHFNALLKPTAGRVEVLGVSTTGKKADLKKIRSNVGLIFQFPENQLFEETVKEDIAFGPRNLGLLSDEIEGRVRSAMEMMGLSYDVFALRHPFSLSGGEMRWVAIAGVLAMQPRVLVMDEPLAGVDPEGRKRLREKMEEFRNSGITMVIVSHSMEQLAGMSDRIIVLKGGRIAADASPREVLAKDGKLREMGLEEPVFVRLAWGLREKGIPVRPDLMSLDEACENIAGLIKPGRIG